LLRKVALLSKQAESHEAAGQGRTQTDTDRGVLQAKRVRALLPFYKIQPEERHVPCSYDVTNPTLCLIVVRYGAKSYERHWDDAIYCTIARESINGHNTREPRYRCLLSIVIDDPTTLLGLAAARADGRASGLQVAGK